MSYFDGISTPLLCLRNVPVEEHIQTINIWSGKIEEHEKEFHNSSPKSSTPIILNGTILKINSRRQYMA